MAAPQKKTVDKYINNRIKGWRYSLERDAHLISDFIGLSTNDNQLLTEDDKKKISDFGQLVYDNTIVTGGALTSFLLGETPNDLDIYIRDIEVAKKVAWLYIRKMMDVGGLRETCRASRIGVDTLPSGEGIHIYIKSQGITGDQISSEQYKYFEHGPENDIDQFFADYKQKLGKDQLEKAYQVSFMTSNAITLSNDIQIITRFCGTPEQIHQNFDFVHTKNYWTAKTGVVYNLDAVIATSEKRLYYIGSRFPVATIFRMRKFIERGWRISAGEMLKVMFDVSKLDLTNVHVLREQSIGMDSAYFNEVIGMLYLDKTTSIDRTYLFKCIDQAFNMSYKDEQDMEQGECDEEDQQTADFSDFSE